MNRFSRYICCFVVAMAVSHPGPVVWADEMGGATLELTLEVVINDVVRYNPLVQESRLHWLISCREARAAWGDFEPELVAHYDRSGLYRENTTLQVFQMSMRTELEEDNEEYGVGLEGKLFRGGSYQFGFSVNKLDNNLAAGPDYQSFVGVSGEQPLLKGSSHGAPMAGVRVAERERSMAFHSYRKQLMTIISQAESAYWNLAYAQEQRRMAAESVEIAINLVEDSREQVKAGKMSELDLFEAEAGLAIRLVQLADSEQEVIEAATQLKLLLANSQIDEDQRVIAADPLVSPSPESSGEMRERNASLEWALVAQPDYLIRREELARERIVLGYQKDQRLPELNLKASYGLNGLGKTFKESLSKFETMDFSAWSVGVEMRIPLFFGIRERNELAASRLRKELAEMQIKATEYEIANSIDSLLQRIITIKKRIENARTVADFKKRLLDVELLRLEAGKSNIRNVYEAEDELAQARKMELESMIRYRGAVMQLAYVRGSVLREKGLEHLENNRLFLAERIAEASN